MLSTPLDPHAAGLTEIKRGGAATIAAQSHHIFAVMVASQVAFEGFFGCYRSATVITEELHVVLVRQGVLLLKRREEVQAAPCFLHASVIE